MAYSFTIIDGQRVEVNVAAAFRRMAADFERDTGCSLHVRDGSRTREEQQKEWDDYVARGFAPPTVARVGESNHEIDGPNGPRSLDLYDSGDDPGVTQFGTARDGWMQRNAGNYGFENEGNDFGEAWHKTYRGDIGGGTDPGTLQPNQRIAGADGVRARREPNTSSEAVDASFLAEGEVGTFQGYVLGQMVEGENRWAKGQFSGLYFWMGGLTPAGVEGLPNLTPPVTPPALGASQRRATSGGTNGRADTNTSSAQVTFLGEGETGDFNGWKHGQSVEGEDRWLRGAYSGAWFWLGGLDPKTVDGLADLNGTVTPPVTPPTDERVIYPTPAAPTYPKARKWAHSSKSEPRKAGATVKVIVFHWWGNDHTPEEEWAYFTGWQQPLGSSPTIQSNNDGTMDEVVPSDGYRPWTTGQLDHQAVTVEAQPGFTDAQYESLAQYYAWAHGRYGIPLQFAVISGTGKAPVVEQGGMTSHKLTPAGKESGTQCPGDLDLDRILARTKDIVAGTGPDPEPPVTPGFPEGWLHEMWQHHAAIGDLWKTLDEKDAG